MGDYQLEVRLFQRNRIFDHNVALHHTFITLCTLHGLQALDLVEVHGPQSVYTRIRDLCLANPKKPRTPFDMLVNHASCFVQ